MRFDRRTKRKTTGDSTDGIRGAVAVVDAAPVIGEKKERTAEPRKRKRKKQKTKKKKKWERVKKKQKRKQAEIGR